MKTTGLLGGLSWESSAEYYRLINEGVRDRLGGFHSAKIIMASVDFAEIEALQRNARWREATAELVDAAISLKSAGADFLVLCSNTMHRMADEIEDVAALPLLHIADATATRIRAAGVATVGLLATRYTMEGTFYTGRLRDRHGVEVIVPDEPDRTVVHRIIYDELVQGRIEERSRERYRVAIAELVARGAEAIVYGCTEITLLVGSDDAPVQVFDTTRIHAEEAVELALGKTCPRREPVAR